MYKFVFDSHFGVCVPVRDKESEFCFSNPETPVLQGLEVYDTLCPINPLTGYRSNPISILRYALSPKNERLLDEVLQVLPEVQQIDVPDDVKLDMLVGRVCTGTFAERDKVYNQLSIVSSVLFPEKVSNANETIEFTPADTQSVSNDA